MYNIRFVSVRNNLPLKERFLSALNIFSRTTKDSEKDIPVKKTKLRNKSKIKNVKSANTAAMRSGFLCPNCSRSYKLKSSLRNHMKWECGKEPQFTCSFCSYKAKQKMHINRHIERMHSMIDYSVVPHYAHPTLSIKSEQNKK
ncbi:hypothetical protein WA026_023216 [Henosepilachna vigintioctopunctata]|uniref:C2H2-type domain-containing protein n=1 Tax=Henosepilachna vigintioctopunctata TaxID=420089 RepID=A0AAW1VDS6_9CUCU